MLKPGVEDILNTDLSFLYASARILEFFNPELSRTSLVGVVSDIRKSMLQVGTAPDGPIIRLYCIADSSVVLLPM